MIAIPETIAPDVVERHFRHRGFGVEFAMEVDWIRSRLPGDAARIVEVGCGGGALFDVFGADRFLGIDYAASGLAYTAHRFPNAALICASADQLPLADACAEAIVAQHVIEHLPNYPAACREWFRVLRPGGSLLVLTPNAAFAHPSVFEDETHVHLFDIDDLSTLVCSVGFGVRDLRTLGLGAFRNHQCIAGGWRLRRFVTRRAQMLSVLPGLRRRGQTLCCCAVRPG